jgi:acetyl esterase/lipase
MNRSPSVKKSYFLCASCRITGIIALLAVLTPAFNLGRADDQFGPEKAPPRTEVNVIYGMYSGLALLFDVYRPMHPNGSGVVFIPGTGWMAQPDMEAVPMKNQDLQTDLFVAKLVSAGYTVFTIDHRGSPQFHYPMQVADAARAVRFVRHHASEYAIDGNRIGAVGYSSGANLVAMLATQATATKTEGRDQDPVSRESSRIRCAVGVSTPTDLSMPTIPEGTQLVGMYLGVPIEQEKDRAASVRKLIAEASPMTYVSRDSAPMLFVHGTADPLVRVESVHRMAAALTADGVPAQVVEIKDSGHWPLSGPGVVDWRAEMIRWLDRFLGSPAQTAPAGTASEVTLPAHNN